MPETHEIIISARNDTKKAFNEMERQARQATTRMEAQFKGLTDSMLKAGAGLAAMGAAGAAFIGSSTMLAARVETLGVVVEQVGKTAGYSAEQMHRFVDGVIAQGITTQAARTSVIKLTQANIDLSKSSELARIAQDAAVIAGIDSSQAFERMIHGITTLNPLILRKMGILVNLQQEYKKVADASGRVTTDLGAMEKQTIAMNAVMKAAERITGSYEAAMGTAGKQITSLPRHIEEARKSIGEAWLPVMSAAVVAVTNLLKSFNNLEPATKRFISLFMGAGSAVAGMVGGMLIFASRLPLMIGGLTKIGLGVEQVILSMIRLTGTSGAATSSVLGLAPALTALATAAVVALALVAVAAAIAKIIEFSQDMKTMTDLVDDSIIKHEKHMRETSESYREYITEMERIAGLTKRTVMTQEEYNDELARLIKGGMKAANAVKYLEKAIIVEADAERKTREERVKGIEVQLQLSAMHREAIVTLEDLAEAEELAAEKAELLKEMFHAQINELTWLAGIKVTEMIDDHTASQYRLTTVVRDFNQELADLTKEYRRGKITKKEYLEQSAELEKKIRASEKAVLAENKAWEENTQQLFFNMASRAIMQSALDPETQFEAIASLMEAFDMIDPAAAALWREMSGAVGDLIAQTTDVEGFTDAVLELVPLMNNRSAVWQWEFRTTGEYPEYGPRSGRVVLDPWTPPPQGGGDTGGGSTGGGGGQQEFQHGGSVERGQPIIPHPGELFMPDTAGRIYSAADLARIGSGSAEAGGGGGSETIAVLKGILSVLRSKEFAPQLILAGSGELSDDEKTDLAYEFLEMIEQRRR